MHPGPINIALSAFLFLIECSLLGCLIRKWDMFPGLLMFICFPIISGAAYLADQWHFLYGPWSLWVLAGQAVGVLEAVIKCTYLLEEEERPRVRWACLLTGVFFVIVVATGSPESYPGWSPALYYSRLGAHLCELGAITGAVGYILAVKGQWTRPELSYAFCWGLYVAGNLASHAIRDRNLWQWSNGIAVSVHLVCAIWWIFIVATADGRLLKPINRSAHVG